MRTICEELEGANVNTKAIRAVMMALDNFNLTDADAMIALVAGIASILHNYPADVRGRQIEHLARILKILSNTKPINEGEPNGQ